MSRRKRAGKPALTPKNRKSASTQGRQARRYVESEVFWLLVICLIATAATVFGRTVHLPGFESRKNPESMLFVGDIMLARNVERLMGAHGTRYPFKGLRDLLEDHDVVIGNFEASIPEHHVQTPYFSFTLSVIKEIAPVLAHVGFTDMTLANNHAYDHGVDGYTHTRKVLADAGLGVAGNPKVLSVDEILYHTVDDVRVAIIPINTIGGAPTLIEMRAVLAHATKESDVQIIFIHWGNEYEHIANDDQRFLAHELIDAGADTIIGTHPHVVQDIEEYRGAAIFYSLGNGIFDQYWNTDVQEGLTVSLSFIDNEIHYALIPISSVAERSAPRPLNRVERAQFLETLASRSEKGFADQIKEGEIIELFNRRSNNTLIHSN